MSDLDANLATADPVICHAGRINHDAYSRMKDHCKRQNKLCVHLESPGARS